MIAVKNKYQRMNKEEKKIILEKYKKTEKGKSMIPRLNRVVITGIIVVLIAGFLYYLAVKSGSIWDYIYASMILIAGLVFIIGSIRIRGKELNKQALKEK